MLLLSCLILGSLAAYCRWNSFEENFAETPLLRQVRERLHEDTEALAVLRSHSLDDYEKILFMERYHREEIEWLEFNLEKEARKEQQCQIAKRQHVIGQWEVASRLPPGATRWPCCISSQNGRPTRNDPRCAPNLKNIRNSQDCYNAYYFYGHT